MGNIDENILNRKIMVNGEVYINGDVLAKFLKGVFSDVNNGYTFGAVEDLSYNIDLLLELQEYNDGDY